MIPREASPMTTHGPSSIAEALATGVAIIDRGDRSRLEIAGDDRAKFLHNLTTNDVKRLAVGRGQEAFVTNPQGKTLGYVILLACDDRILLRADRDGLAGVLPHLEKYGVFDDVAITDISAASFEFHLAGVGADSVLRAAGGEAPPAGELSHAPTRIAGFAVRAIREAPTGRPGLTLIGDAGGSAEVLSRLRREGEALGMVELDPDVYDLLRIEAGTPVFGRDVTAENLPQEIGRDDRAISFVKGCYLGQETVARIDALGHVNKVLKGLWIEGPASPSIVGATLELDGKKVGTVTSAAYSQALGTTVALGYVRTTHAAPGTALVVVTEGDDPRPAVVSDLPISS
jgi:tRNA-modifying protein YgfZ